MCLIFVHLIYGISCQINKKFCKFCKNCAKFADILQIYLAKLTVTLVKPPEIFWYHTFLQFVISVTENVLISKAWYQIYLTFLISNYFVICDIIFLSNCLISIFVISKLASHLWYRICWYPICDIKSLISKNACIILDLF